jgi:hypothetical protein
MGIWPRGTHHGAALLLRWQGFCRHFSAPARPTLPRAEISMRAARARL